MILFEHSAVRLDYDPTTDIKVVEYPDLHDYLLPEIKCSVDKIVEVIRNDVIKNLMLDSTRTVFTVGEDQSKGVAMYLAAGIMKTRVQKMARVQSLVEPVEKRAHGNIKYIQESQPLPFKLQNFTDRSVAL